MFANAAELRFVYEQQPDFTSLPTFACTFPFLGGLGALEELTAAGLRVAPDSLLHAEQETSLHAPLQWAQRRLLRLANSSRLVGVAAKAGGTLAVLETQTRTVPGGVLVATNTTTVLLRGVAPPAGAPGLPATPRVQPPSRPPDAVWEERLEPSAALLYRLCGDTNPLHADVRVAARAGFPAPILHGLCSLGYAARAVLMRLCDGQAERVCGVRCRFAGVVFPGDALSTSMWRVSPTRIAFEARVGDRTALTGGVVELNAGPRL